VKRHEETAREALRGLRDGVGGIIKAREEVAGEGPLYLDQKCHRLIGMVIAEHAISCEDPRINEFADDRGVETDTINLCIEAGGITQIGSSDYDDFRLVAGWWPHATPKRAEQAAVRKATGELVEVARMVDAWGHGLRHETAHESKMVKAARTALAPFLQEQKEDVGS
jgi:hypothetical protein